MNDASRSNLSAMILATLDGTIQEEDFLRINHYLKTDPEALSQYIDIVSIYFNLSETSKISTQLQAESLEMLQALASYERSAPSIEIERPKEKAESEYIVKLKTEKQTRTISKISLYTAIISTAALIIILVYAFTHPRQIQPLVATLSDSINAHWADTSVPVTAGSDLRTGTRMLLKGLIKIKFDDGAEVILEGPSEFTLESSKSIFLLSGKLVAHVSEHAVGFMVNTPSSSIVDLGTEFGVTVEADGSNDIHMFAGRASLIAGRVGDKKTTHSLEKGLAKYVDINSGEVTDVEFNNSKYVRRLDSKSRFIWRGQDIDLSDIIGGGNGFGTGLKGYALDPFSGKYISFPELLDLGYLMDTERDCIIMGKEQYGPGRYQEVSILPFIDGLFVPDGSINPVQISSEGHTFQHCPDTSNRFWVGVLNNNAVKDGEKFISCHRIYLGGERYGGKDKPGIFMHTNIGITFDLNMIRSTFPGITIKRFKSLCGVMDLEVPGFPEANFYVLVDGEVRFEAVKARSGDAVRIVNVAINDNDRFLTLITTDADGDTGDDHCIFALPRLELASEE